MKPAQYIAPFAILAGLGCASRSLPTSFPVASPASPASFQPARSHVTRAVEEDPPLPGAPAEGWPGLDRGARPDPTVHRHHAGDDDAPAAAATHHIHHEAAPDTHPSDTTASEEAGPPALYVCPMHPEVTSDHEGRCPKCGMNLEPKP